MKCSQRGAWSAVACAMALLVASAAAVRNARAEPAQAACVEVPVNAPYDASPVFSNDGSHVVFMRGRGLARRLYESRRSTREWAQPTLLPFSSSWMDIEPAMSTDGSFLVFASNRPIETGGERLDAHFGGEDRPGRGGNLWSIRRTRQGWAAPEHLPTAINTGTAVYAPSVAGDGSVYFMRADPGTGEFRLYRSLKKHGTYQIAEPLPFSDGVTADFDPSISADQRVLVFTSDRPSLAGSAGRLFSAYQSPAGWSQPIPLPWYGTEARLAQHDTLYFTGTDHCVQRVNWRRGAKVVE